MSRRSIFAPYGHLTVGVVAAGAVLALVAATAITVQPSEATPTHAVASARPSPKAW
ncbi:hypothetical protein ABGB07_19130 [Micromonosporaceae bacterium B7E4]